MSPTESVSSPPNVCLGAVEMILTEFERAEDVADILTKPPQRRSLLKEEGCQTVDGEALVAPAPGAIRLKIDIDRITQVV